MEKTITMDMTTQVAGWKQGVADGTAYAKSGQDMPEAEKIDELAAPSSPGGDKHANWLVGYRKGFREGVKRFFAGG
ncbi:MAG: hypothetical protein AAGK14_00050 [Verrucomicrobiota bacterium]